VDITKTITHLSLCSGYEGIGLGLRRVLPNLREIAYVEREGFPVANLVAKMEAGELDAAPVFTDVKTFPYRKFRGLVDILSGGFPCQPFSAAGKRQATEDPRHLFPYIADGIRECQPRIVFLENVQGILSCKTGDGEPVLQYVLRELEGMGYRATAGIFSAEEVGAPHQRKRVFILGMANSEDIGRGGRTYRNGDDQRGLQEQEAQEQSNLRSKTAGCSRDPRGELAYSNDCGSVGGDEIGSDQVRQVEQHSTQRKDSPTGGGETEELGNAECMRESQPQGSEQDKRGRTQHSSEELGNAKHDGSSECSEKARGEVRESQEGRVQEPQRGSNATSELGNSDSQRCQGERLRRDKGKPESSLSGRSSQELANTNNSGGDQDRQPTELRSGWIEQPPIHRWPARPGEAQQEWEEPRVVADTKSQQGSPRDNGGEPGASSQSEQSQSGGGHSGSLRESNGQAEPQLGRTSNGSNSRVDRLRLLGNGVVPATAAKAFVTLIQRLI